MATMKEKMQQARQLIQQKRYDEARAILRTVDHDKAYEWLDKIDALLADGKSLPVAEKPKAEAQTSIDYQGKTKNDDDTSLARLVCPACETQSIHGISLTQMATTSGFLSVQCLECKTTYHTQIVIIRAKRSRGHDKISREFDIRVTNLDGTEDFIQFTNQSYEDMELRAGDAVAFSHLNGKLRLVQNFAIHRYWKLANDGCFPTAQEGKSQHGCIRIILIVAVLFIVWLLLLPIIYNQPFIR